ncbi:serine hydrolase [Saccharopolyspora spinosa]|uniref:serine hydrolase n=1 Tax=Saccharopolyspora spinosa TaxID=60894 RepID=UPI000237989C|nr:serine hydrolase [Saccharopolyspora spinosa]
MLGNALPTEQRDVLRDLLERNATSAQRIRAGVPQGRIVADKTGTGDYGTLNDIAVARHPERRAARRRNYVQQSHQERRIRLGFIAEAAAHPVATFT